MINKHALIPYFCVCSRKMKKTLYYQRIRVNIIMEYPLPKPKLIRQTNASESISDGYALDYTSDDLFAPSSKILYDNPPYASYYVVDEDKDTRYCTHYEPDSPMYILENEEDKPWWKYWSFCVW